MNHMTNFEDQPPPAVGAYWIKEEEYSALMKVFDDGVTMPRTWKEWLKIAEEMERGLKAYGHVVMRVHIDPKTFPDWCAAHGTSTGREGRRRFVAAAVPRDTAIKPDQLHRPRPRERNYSPLCGVVTRV
jgi:hypothetical protein